MTTALFLGDVLLDSLMLAIALRIERKQIRLWRVLCGACMGACIAAWTRAAGLSGPCLALLWLPSAMLMMFIAGGGKHRKNVRSGMVLLCAAGLLGGIVQALYGATGSFLAAYALGMAASVTTACSALRAERAAGDAVRAKVSICHRGCGAQFEGIIDSGNTLRDYLFHLPVIVLPEADAAKLELGSVLLRPIFADTAGGKMMMSCFVPKAITIECGGKRYRVKAAAALSSRMRSGSPALVPAVLLREERR